MSVSDTVSAFTQPTTYTATSVAVVSSTTAPTSEIPWIAIVSLGIAMASLAVNWHYKRKDSKSLHKRREL